MDDAQDTVHVEVTLNLTFNAAGMDPDELKQRLVDRIGKVMASGALTGNGISEDVDFDQNARQTSSFRARKESAGTAGALGDVRFG